jgi:hypothetical protein
LEITLEKLINLVTAEVVKELKKQGIQIISSSDNNGLRITGNSLRTKSEKIDMSRYRTPVLTEIHIRRLHELTGEVIIPSNTIITPKAKEIIKEKKLIITREQ